MLKLDVLGYLVSFGFIAGLWVSFFFFFVVMVYQSL